jgi:thiamine-monophosphate kinase
VEARLVKLLQELFPAQGEFVPNGDDAAVVKTGALTAVTVDTHVAGVHFQWPWATPEQLGARFVGVVLSDLAAMGANPHFGVLSLLLPKGASFSVLSKFLRGIARRAASESLVIVGGDVASAAGFAAVMTALGEAPPLPLRRTARAGDLLCVSGPIGRPAFELQRLLRGEKFRPSRWMNPPSRIALGRQLAHTQGVQGAMDISDGLFLDARRMAERSSLGLRIDADAIPMEPVVRKAVAGLPPVKQFELIGGGEDYELLVAVKPKAVVPDLIPIGRFVPNGFSVTSQGRDYAWPKAGFFHGGA